MKLNYHTYEICTFSIRSLHLCSLSFLHSESVPCHQYHPALLTKHLFWPELHSTSTITSYLFPALNLKFTVGNESVCIGIDINKSKHLPPEWSIFYDCPWYSQLIEGQRVLLEYIATGNEYKEARRFSFITPATMKIGKRNTTQYPRSRTCCNTTYSMVQDIIWKADCHSACQRISCFLMEPKGSLPC
jgi:hypothetical protein